MLYVAEKIRCQSRSLRHLPARKRSPDLAAAGFSDRIMLTVTAFQTDAGCAFAGALYPDGAYTVRCLAVDDRIVLAGVVVALVDRLAKVGSVREHEVLQVKRPKRLDLDRDAERAPEALPGPIVANWVKGRL